MLKGKKKFIKHFAFHVTPVISIYSLLKLLNGKASGWLVVDLLQDASALNMAVAPLGCCISYSLTISSFVCREVPIRKVIYGSIVSAIRHEHFGMKLVHVFKEMEDSWSIVTRLCSGDPVPVVRIYVRIDGETSKVV